MAYVKTNWQAGVTPLSEANMDHLETQYDEAVSDLVAKATYNAHSILIAISDNTPVVLEVAASRIIGRKAAGNIVALTGAEVLTICGWTANKLLKGAGAGVAPTEIDVPAITSGTYTGNAADDRAIPHGLGSVPKMVLIVQAAGAKLGVVDTTKITNVYTDNFATVTIADATNFRTNDTTVLLNSNATVYNWVAFG